jgi:hypothetical protein
VIFKSPRAVALHARIRRQSASARQPPAGPPPGRQPPAPGVTL